MGILATFYVGTQSWFEVPKGHGFIYAFQPLIATFGVIIAALLAYEGAVYREKNEDIRKGKYYYANISAIRDNLITLLSAIEEIEDTNDIEKFYGPMQIAENVKYIDFNCFNYDYIAQFTTVEIRYAKLIMEAFRRIEQQSDEYTNSITTFFDERKIKKIEINADYFNPRIKLLSRSCEHAIEMIDEVDKIIGDKYK